MSEQERMNEYSVLGHDAALLIAILSRGQPGGVLNWQSVLNEVSRM